MSPTVVSGVFRSSWIAMAIRVFMIMSSVGNSLITIFALVRVASCKGSWKERNDFPNVGMRICRNTQIVMMVSDAWSVTFWTGGRRPIWQWRMYAATPSAICVQIFTRRDFRQAWSWAISKWDTSAGSASWAWAPCRCCGSRSGECCGRPASRWRSQDTRNAWIVWIRCKRSVCRVATTISIRYWIHSSCWTRIIVNVCLVRERGHQVRMRIIHRIPRISSRSQIARRRHGISIVTMHFERRVDSGQLVENQTEKIRVRMARSSERGSE